MRRHTAVSIAVTILVLVINIVCGLNSSSASYLSILTTPKEFSETRSTLFKTSLSISSTWGTTSNYVTNTTSQVRRRSSTLLITVTVPQSTSSKLHSLSSASFLSIAVSDDLSLASHVSPSKISSQSLIFLSTGNHSFSQTQTSESHVSSHVYSSVFERVNFSSPAKPFTSSILLDVSSLLASGSTALGPNYSSSAISLMPRSPTMSTSFNKPHFSTSSVMSPIQTISSLSLLASPPGPHSSVATSAAHVPSSQYSFVSKSATLFSLVKSSRSSAVSISTTILAQTKLTGTTAMTSGLKSSTANISAASSQSSFQTPNSLKLSILSQSKILKSLKITTVRPSLSEQFISETKTSQMKSHNTLTKISSFNTKEAAVSSASVINNIFTQFDGKLVLSPKSSFKKKHNLKIFADSIESVLDTALNQANGFLYSKVLVITQSNEDKYNCMFQIIMRKSTLETADTLKEKIIKFNQTDGFGHFMLHSVETSSHDSSAETSLYLWAIIVIAALGVLCFLLLVAFICTQKKLKKSKKTNYSSPKHDNNSNQRYSDLFPSVFDGIDESKNEPLKLTSVSSTESKKPLKLSVVAGSDSERDETPNGQQSNESSNEEDGSKNDVEAYVQEQSPPGKSSLQIQDTDDEDDETKFSTFSRKH